MPIHPKVIAALKKAGLIDERKEGDESYDFAVQFTRGIHHSGDGHASWHWALNIIRDKGEIPAESVVAAKRVLSKKGKTEYVLVSYHFEGTHYSGKPLSESWREYGRYEIPLFGKAWNPKKLRWEPSQEIIGYEEHFEIPFRGEKTKLISPVTEKEVLLTSLIDESTRFHIVNSKSQKLVMTRDQFFNLTREEAIKLLDTPPTQTALESLTTALTKAQELTGTK